jgi:hypothetical protein
MDYIKNSQESGDLKQNQRHWIPPYRGTGQAHRQARNDGTREKYEQSTNSET